MKARYTYLDENIIEVVAEEGSIEVRILSPQGQVIPLSLDDSTDTELSEGPEPLSAEAPSRRKASFIRGFWTFTFASLGMFAAGLAYVQTALADIGLPKWTAIFVGALIAAVIYGLKKFYKPDGTW